MSTRNKGIYKKPCANHWLARLRYPGINVPRCRRIEFWSKVAKYTKADGTRHAALATIERLLCK